MFGLCWGCIHFLFLFSILKSCTHFLFSSIFLFGIIFYFVFPFMTTTNKQRERERERERPIDFIFLQKCNCIHFQENENTKKLYTFFVFNFFFFNTKNKIWTQIQSQTSFLVLNSTKTENKYKIQNFFAQTKRTLRLPWSWHDGEKKVQSILYKKVESVDLDKNMCTQMLFMWQFEIQNQRHDSQTC